MHIYTYLKGHVLPDASSDTCTCTKAHSDTSLHAQALPAARQTHACMHTDRTRVSAREYPQARSSAVCLLPAAQLRLAPDAQALPSSFHLPHWPRPRPQAPGWQLPHSPRCRLSQVSHPKVEPGQRGLLQPAWGINVGVAGGSQNPALVEDQPQPRRPVLQGCRLPLLQVTHPLQASGGSPLKWDNMSVPLTPPLNGHLTSR